MPRRASRAPAGPRRQQSPALIIALVFMVLLSLVLGVFLYLEKDKTLDAQTKQKKADEEHRRIESEAREYLREYFLAKLRSWLDRDSVTGEEYAKMVDRELKYRDRNVQGTEWFQALKTKFEGPSNDPANRNGIVGPLDRDGKPQKSVPSELARLTTLVATTAKERDGKTAELKTTEEQFKKYRDEWNQTVVANAQKQAQEAEKKQSDAALAQKDATIQDLKTKIADVTKEMELGLSKNNEQTAALRKQLREAYEKLVSEQQTEYQLQLARLKGSQIIHLDQPRGQIARVVGTEQVYINLGSDERVMPGLTFSVYGKGPGGKPESDPKAKIEVVAVVGPKQSLARITQMYLSDAIRGQYVDPTRVDPWVKDPREFYRARTSVLGGDLIYNPAWDPQRKVRVALAGVFDLDGDGSNDIDTFRRMLRDMNAEVVAYTDDRGAEPKLVGAIDFKVDFLVLGGMPETVGEKVVDTRLAQRGGQMVLLASQLQEEATKKGIEIIPLQRFLTRIGYSSIRVAAQRTNGNGNGAAKPAPAAKPEPNK